MVLFCLFVADNKGKANWSCNPNLCLTTILLFFLQALYVQGWPNCLVDKTIHPAPLRLIPWMPFPQISLCLPLSTQCLCACLSAINLSLSACPLVLSVCACPLALKFSVHASQHPISLCLSLRTQCLCLPLSTASLYACQIPFNLCTFS